MPRKKLQAPPEAPQKRRKKISTPAPTEGPKPRTGVDRRPYGVADADGKVIVRCWYKSTAEDYIKAVRMPGLKPVKL